MEIGTGNNFQNGENPGEYQPPNLSQLEDRYLYYAGKFAKSVRVSYHVDSMYSLMDRILYYWRHNATTELDLHCLHRCSFFLVLFYSPFCLRLDKMDEI